MSHLDVVIFGATGFTGKHAVEELARINKKDPSLTWGIAGRSRIKLENLLKNVEQKTGVDVSKVEIIIADVNDKQSIRAMTSVAKVIVNCCGPYRLYGEVVVKSCIDTKTHHVDVSAEPQFLDSIKLNYHKEAEDAGVYIISACGLDCIPNDMGVVFLTQNFKGQLNTIESYATSAVPYKFVKIGTTVVHYGTWSSLIHSLAHWDELPGLRRRIHTKSLPSSKPLLPTRPILHKRNDMWCLPFPGADNTIVQATQRFFYETENKRPIQFKVYAAFPYMILAIFTGILAFGLFLMSKMPFTKGLLLKHPRLFSFGLVSHKGPVEEFMNKNTFNMVLHGEGWDETVRDVDATPPNKKMVAKVSGVNPAYGATVIALLYSALTILKEEDKMPGRGGVLTTGAAFSKTSLIKNLHENNWTFEIIE